MVKTGGDDPLREQDLATLFRVSREDSAEELYRHLWVRVINRKPHPRGTEASFHSFWDDVIGHTLQLILKCGFIRDSNHETSTDLQRPDYGLMLGSLCVFRGEEKPPDSQEKPINELREKVRWESTALPYILGEPYISSMSIKSKGTFLRLWCYWSRYQTRYDSSWAT